MSSSRHVISVEDCPSFHSSAIPSKITSSADDVPPLSITAFKLAIEFLRSHQWEIDDVQHLSRCKPSDYYSKIEKTKKKIEQPYIKDPNGHSESPINGNLNGLFLTPGIIDCSPFGDKCYEYPLDALISVGEYDLYFADFYCPQPLLKRKKKKNSSSSIEQGHHKITLVIARKGSMEQRFCEATLVRLSWFGNPFFRLSPDSKSAEVAKIRSEGPMIEVFLSEALCLKTGKGKSVRAIGPGRSNPKGIPHNKSCPICNIDVGSVHPTYYTGGVALYLHYPCLIIPVIPSAATAYGVF